MFGKWVHRLLIFLVVWWIIASTLILIHHLHMPHFTPIKVNATFHPKNNHIIYLSFKLQTQNIPDHYYFVLYPNIPTTNWSLFPYQNPADCISKILETYLPSDDYPHVIRKKSQTRSNISIKLQSKKNIQQLSPKEATFDLLYIHYIQIPFFPKFYFTQHQSICIFDSLK